MISLAKLFALQLRVMTWARGGFYRMFIIACGGECGKGLRVDKGLSWKYPPHPGIRFGEHVILGRDIIVDVPPEGRLQLGDHVKFTGFSVIAANHEVRIGDHTLIGEMVSIRDADHEVRAGCWIRLQGLVSTSVFIGQDVWLGRGVTVLRGAHVGDGAVIAANALVRNEQVLAGSISVGSPLRHVKFRG
ncbi:MAG: acyltransferase [Rubrivivax sp.]|nr:MAG: acyltransferase [Rubrivivax sp.]